MECLNARKAVVGIHGVGSPEQGATAAAVVGLLSVAQSYSFFQETSLRIPLLPPKVVRECSGCLLPDQEFAAAQIKDFVGDGETMYSTSVLNGRCRSDDSTIDVFELYWGDLSQTRSLIGSIVQTIFLPYRFIFLGGIAWRSFTPIRPCRFWISAGVLYRTARDLITILVPLVLIESLVLGGIAATLRIPLEAVPWVTSTILALAAVVLAGIGLYRSHTRRTTLAFGLSLVFCGLLAGFIGFLLSTSTLTRPYNSRDILAAELLVACWALIAWLMSLTELWGERSLAQWMWRIISAATLAYFAFYGFKYKIDLLVQDLLTDSIIWAFFGAALSLFSTLLCFACVLPTYVRTPLGRRQELNGTLWTMWFGVSVTTAAILVPIAALPSLLDLPPFSWISTGKWSNIVNALVLGVIARALSGVTIGGVVAITLLLFAAILALGPSLYAEFRPASAHRGNAMRLGQWLSNGLGCITVAGVLAGACIIVFPVAWLVLVWIFAADTTSNLNQVADWFGEGFWRLVGISFTTLAFKLSGPATHVITTVVGIVLDVELYLRDRPRGKTTRALIHQRFLTLLDHLECRHYDQIVFIAHSQGTVVLMDALRFIWLNQSNHQLSSRLNVSPSMNSVITMGSPLRQLYASTFPLLFGWAKTPEPAFAGVSSWSNLYRSGDYVGRQLSQSDQTDGIYDSTAASYQGFFKEYCIGPGAHTHYWNSPEVAHELDRVLRERRAAPTDDQS
jgi:hypothetical protein